MNTRERELELAWLTKKVGIDENLIERAEDFFHEKQHGWSRGVVAMFLDMIERMKDQLYYEQHRLEKLAWALLRERERGD